MSAHQRQASGWLQQELQAAAKEVDNWPAAMRESTPVSRFDAANILRTARVDENGPSDKN